MAKSNSPFDKDLDYAQGKDFVDLKPGVVFKIMSRELYGNIEVGDLIVMKPSEDDEHQISSRIVDEITEATCSADELGAQVSRVTDEAVLLKVLSTLGDGGES
jgi:hypothetical protein